MEKTLMKTIKLLIVSLTLTCSVPGFAGKIIKSAQKGDWEEVNSIMYVEGNKVRIDDSYISIIFDFDKDEYFLLYNSSNVFIHDKIENLRSEKEKYELANKEKMLAGLSAEEKEEVLAMYEGISADLNKPYLGVVDYRQTDEVEDISGFKCTKYIVTENDVEIEDLWIAEGTNFVNMRKIKSFFKDFGVPDSYHNSDIYIRLLDKGMVLRSFDYSLEVTFKVYEVEEVDIDESQFLPKEDMKKVSWLELDSYLNPMQ